MLIESWPVGDVTPYPGNPRVMRDAADRVAKLIKRFGFRQPIVVDSAGVIVIGHTRLAAAKLLGLTHVPVHRATELTEDEARSLRIADNRSHEYATWDFLAWVTDHMPERLEVINTGLDLGWLAANTAMLFPQDAATAAQWFAKVQHTAQRRFYRARGLDVLLLGRRREDGNFCGRGADWYESGGVVRFSPLAGWTHADVFAAIDHYGLSLPPFYAWPRGYRCGTHPWAARQWCNSVAHGWSEVHAIDPAIVRAAADVLPSAAEYLERAA